MLNMISKAFLINLLDKREDKCDAKKLYHVNTITTSCAYLEKDALLSRAYAKSNGIPQTPQDSDAIDEKFGIDDLIFLNFVDIHRKAHNACYYGSVSFELDYRVINQADEIYITKSNPFTARSKWRNTWDTYAESELWEKHADFYRCFFSHFDHMIMLKTSNSKLKFRLNSMEQPLLKNIKIDFPQIERTKDIKIRDNGISTLKKCNKKTYHVGFRKCNKKCKCRCFYTQDNSKNLQKFFEYGKVNPQSSQ